MWVYGPKSKLSFPSLTLGGATMWSSYVTADAVTLITISLQIIKKKNFNIVNWTITLTMTTHHAYGADTGEECIMAESLFIRTDNI